MKNKVLLCFDYDLTSGYGHLSRTEVFFDALPKDLYQVFILTEIDPILQKLDFTFLKDVIWIDIDKAKQMSFDLAYLDTYSEKSLIDFESILAKNKVLLVDSNFQGNLPCWANLVIVLEQALIRYSDHEIQVVSGLTLIKDRIKNTRTKRQEIYSIKSKPLVAIVNFGGSLQSKPHLFNLKSTFLRNRDLQYKVYCAEELIPFLLNEFEYIENVTLMAIGNSYYDELITSDFLITSSGTSFLEALYIDIPIVLFNLYESAQLNFTRFRSESTVLYSGESADLIKKWQSAVTSKLNSTYLEFRNAKSESDISFLDSKQLFLAISNLK
jgi:spore coat polysaccharide biosynthesis predicted glycosyltransferase SpsG